MKKTLFFLCWLGLAVASLRAQTYFIDRVTIAGGGGVSNGSGYSVAGTIGQPEAGALSGGDFTLTAGFWSVVTVVQTPDAPGLSAVCTATNTVVISWPGPDSGWRLQTTPSLSTTPIVWTEITPPYPTHAAGCYFTVPSPAGNRFYRLYRP
jgi:hypothetical protein